MFKALISILILFTSSLAHGQMRVYTVAGNIAATTEGDGGPATAALVNATEGIWIDSKCNIYYADGYRKVRTINNVTGIISTTAGTETKGYSGDNAPANKANIALYGLYADDYGNIYFADALSDRIRRIDAATGIITTFAGGGIMLGDDGPATDAQLIDPVNVYGDKNGNVYIGEKGRLRKVNTSGIISTIAGTGVIGFSGDGGSATNAQLANPHTILFDKVGNLFFADRSNNRIRKIDRSGIITTYAGSTSGYSGDGGPATAAQLSGPISFVIDYLGNMVIGDNQNNCMRLVDAKTGIITHFAGVGPSKVGSYAEGTPATAAEIHPEFMYLDRSGNLYFSCWCNQIRKITNYLPSLAGTDNGCGETAVPELAGEQVISLFPNPATNELHLQIPRGAYKAYTISNTIRQRMLQQPITRSETTIPTAALPPGMYFLTLAGGGGMKTVRFVKE